MISKTMSHNTSKVAENYNKPQQLKSLAKLSVNWAVVATFRKEKIDGTFFQANGNF